MKITEQNTNQNICDSPSNKIALITTKGNDVTVYNNSGNVLHIQKRVKQDIFYDENFIVSITRRKYQGNYKIQVCKSDFSILEKVDVKFRFACPFDEINQNAPILLPEISYSHFLKSISKIDKNDDKKVSIYSRMLFGTLLEQVLSIAKSYEIPFSLLRDQIINPNFNKESLIGQIYLSLEKRIIWDIYNNTNQVPDISAWYIRNTFLKFKGTNARNT